MTDLSNNTRPEVDGPRGGGSPPKMPTWVKAFCVVALALLLLIVGLHLTGRGFGNHGWSTEHGTQ